MKKLTRKVLWVLDEFSYFLPDVFLVLAVLSFFKDFGEYDLLVTVLLFITYLSVSYGEYMYHRIQVARKMVDNIIEKHFKEIENQINTKFVTFEGLLALSDIIDETIDDKFEELRYELLKGELDNALDSEDSDKEVQE